MFAGEEEFLKELLSTRVPAGVDEAAYVKAGFLAAVATGKTKSPLFTPIDAIKLLGTMQVPYSKCSFHCCAPRLGRYQTKFRDLARCCETLLSMLNRFPTRRDL